MACSRRGSAEKAHGADPAHDQFTHVRIIIGVVAGLSVTRLLTGLARFARDPAAITSISSTWLAIVPAVRPCFLGALYSGRQGVLFGWPIAGMLIADRRYHGGFVLLAIAAEIYWIIAAFDS